MIPRDPFSHASELGVHLHQMLTDIIEAGFLRDEAMRIVLGLLAMRSTS